MMASGTMLSILALLILIICSALVSGSEVAYFSLGRKELAALEEEDTPSSRRIRALMAKPKNLLATILISNNFVNIALVIVSAVVINRLIGDDLLLRMAGSLYDLGLSGIASVDVIAHGINFLITVVGVTFLLVLFGEIAPKIYANLHSLSFARMMSRPLTVLNTLFGPFSRVLVGFSQGLENRVRQSENYQSSTSREDIDAAIDLTVSADDSSSEEEADILKSIVTFGDLTTKQIMKPRLDVLAIDIETDYEEVIEQIRSSGYSRIPVYEEDFDNIKGILYAKDLLGFLDEGKDFKWQDHIRSGILYAPESKNIDDLLKEFQAKRNHMAIVVDEYGGCSGIVTLEDVMEEVIGDIRDEFDEEEDHFYVQVGEGNYIFEGKTLLNDICRVMGLETGYFDDEKGEADSIAGLMLEILGVIPEVENELTYKSLYLKVVAVSNRRIEKINIRQL